MATTSNLEGNLYVAIYACVYLQGKFSKSEVRPKKNSPGTVMIDRATYYRSYLYEIGAQRWGLFYGTERNGTEYWTKSRNGRLSQIEALGLPLLLVYPYKPLGVHPVSD